MDELDLILRDEPLVEPSARLDARVMRAVRAEHRRRIARRGTAALILRVASCAVACIVVWIPGWLALGVPATAPAAPWGVIVAMAGCALAAALVALMLDAAEA